MSRRDLSQPSFGDALVSRWMVEGANPAALAIERRLRCVAPCGVVSSVWRITSATSSSPIWRGAPGRGSSRRPSIRRSANRRRHLPTVLGAAPTRRLMSLFSAPSAASRTMRARWASPLRCLPARRQALQLAPLAFRQINRNRPLAHHQSSANQSRRGSHLFLVQDTSYFTSVYYCLLASIVACLAAGRAPALRPSPPA
jgi:hypothetical protein